MLVIRQSQIDAMLIRQKNTAAYSLGLSLKAQSPFFQHYTDEQLQHWVTTQIDYLASLRIDDKASVISIIEIMALYGDKFERCPDPSWALEIIENVDRNQSFRAKSLKEEHESQLEQ